MLTLYTRSGCPFCERVLDRVAELKLKIEEKNIGDDKIAAELISLGGKRMAPFLVDSEKEVQMYESVDIIKYLNQYYNPEGIEGDTDDNKDNRSNSCTLEY